MTATTNPKTMEALRQAFKQGNRLMLLLWRLGLGPMVNAAPESGGQIMVLIHTGRRSGLPRRTPVNYAIVDNDIYCTAGFGSGSDWYRNILARPDVEVWLPEGWWQGVAEDISTSPRRLPLLREVIRASGFAGRLVGLDAEHMPDSNFAAETAPYRLIRIRRTVPRTGPGGPGDLVWVWPWLTGGLAIAVAAVLLRRPARSQT